MVTSLAPQLRAGAPSSRRRRRARPPAPTRTELTARVALLAGTCGGSRRGGRHRDGARHPRAVEDDHNENVEVPGRQIDVAGPPARLHLVPRPVRTDDVVARAFLRERAADRAGDQGLRASRRARRASSGSRRAGGVPRRSPCGARGAQAPARRFSPPAVGGMLPPASCRRLACRGARRCSHGTILVAARAVLDRWWSRRVRRARSPGAGRFRSRMSWHDRQAPARVTSDASDGDARTRRGDMGILLQDVRYGLRIVGQAMPGFTAIALIALALGDRRQHGQSVSVVNGVLLQPGPSLPGGPGTDRPDRPRCCRAVGPARSWARNPPSPLGWIAPDTNDSRGL